jgi:hypothetical protein
MAVQNEQEAVKALDQLTAEISKPRKADLGSICATYKTIKPFLQGVLFLIARIPTVGKKVADAVGSW